VIVCAPALSKEFASPKHRLGFAGSFVMAGGRRRATISSDAPAAVAMSRGVLPNLFSSAKNVSGVPATWSISLIFLVTQVFFLIVKHGFILIRWLR